MYNEFTRYIINGIVATFVHFSILMLNLEILDFPSAGLANFVAAFVGITFSFFGSRYFVFQKTAYSFKSQVLKFSSLYAVIAILHGLVLSCWTDWMAFDYKIGFLIATTIQVCCSYLGNKRWVFAV